MDQEAVWNCQCLPSNHCVELNCAVHASSLVFSFLYSGIPVAMSFGFCFAVLPLLSLDPSSVFGQNHTLIQRIPSEELSCPEEYLESIAVVPAKKLEEEDVETGKAADGSEDEIVEVQNESTPLLSSS